MRIVPWADPLHFARIVEELRIGDLTGKAINMQVLERPIVDVEIETVIALREAAAVGRGEARAPCPVDGAAVEAQPVAVNLECIDGALVEGAPPRRPDIHQQIAAEGDAVDQKLDQLLRALPAFLVPVIAPRTREGVADFPSRLAALEQRGRARRVLLGRHYVRHAGDE